MVRQPLLPIRRSPAVPGRRRVPVVALAAAALVALFFGVWITLYVQQRTLQSRAEALVADLQTIEVGTSTAADAQSITSKWYRWRPVETNCADDGCSSVIRLRHKLPGVLTGFGNPSANNLLARITDHLGLRSARVSAGLKYKDGMVTGKAFSVEVTLPFDDWFERGAFVPDLAVFSSETAAFTEAELAHVVPTYPYRVVRRIKGPYGLRITFMPQEPAADKAKYMDFRLNCISQFAPCRQEREILPAASELVKEVF